MLVELRHRLRFREEMQLRTQHELELARRLPEQVSQQASAFPCRRAHLRRAGSM